MVHLKIPLPDPAATDALGRSLARHLEPGLIIYLHGDLGAGKTALTRALLHAAGYTGHVKSPTYTLAEHYEITIADQKIAIMHFDLYRMTSPDEFLEAGFRELFNSSTICIVEWPENAKNVLPAPDLELYFTVAGAGRLVELQALSAKGISCLNQLHFMTNL